MTKWYRPVVVSALVLLGACDHNDDKQTKTSDVSTSAAPPTDSTPSTDPSPSTDSTLPAGNEADSNDETLCLQALVVLDSGQIEQASKILATRETVPECKQLLDAIAARTKAAVDAHAVCVTSADKSNAAKAEDRAKLIVAALRECANAARLDANADVATVLAKLNTDTDAPASAQGQLESWWSKFWDPLKSGGERLAQGLLVLLLLAPAVNYLGTLIGRWGRKPLQSMRSVLRRDPWKRQLIAGLLGIGLVGVLTGPGKLQSWSAGALGGGALVVLVIFGLSVGSWHKWLTTTKEGRWAAGVVVLAAAVGGWFLGQKLFDVDFDLTERAVVAGVVTVVLVLVIAWVLAQRANLRFDAFAKEDGAASSSYGQLVASEVFRLNAARAVQVDIIDAATATPIEESSLTTLAGAPENKIIGALVKLVRTVFVPGTDYLVVGQLIAAGSNDPGVSVQLKYNRRMVAGDALYGMTVPAPTGGGGDSKPASAGKKAAEGESADDTPKTPGHNDILGIVATWVIVELQRELSGDDNEHLVATFGCANTRSLLYQHIASQAMNAGDLAAARRAYAQALDQDFSNAAARLGLAQVLARSLGQGANPIERKSALKGLERAATEAYTLWTSESPKPPIDVELSARYTELAAWANWQVLNGKSAVTLDKLGAFMQCIDGLGEGQRKGAMLAAYHSLRLTTLTDDEIATGSSTTAESIKEAEKSLRGRYNLAARFCRMAEAARTERREEIETYLLEAVSLPLLATFATTDPYFDEVRSEAWFKAIVPASKRGAGSGAEGPAAVHTIGEHYAALLSAQKVDSFGDLRKLDPAGIDKIAKSLKVNESVVQAWKRAAELESIDGIGPVTVNLLLLSGVPSRGALANRSLAELHDTMDAVGLAHGFGPTPSIADIRKWQDEIGRPPDAPDD